MDASGRKGRAGRERAARRGCRLQRRSAAAANALGLTTQTPIRTVYLTNGPNRTLSLGNQTVEFRHAPAWQLLLADRPAGKAVRALAWLGRGKAGTALALLKRKLGPAALGELVSVGPRRPTGWPAPSVRRRMPATFPSRRTRTTLRCGRQPEAGRREPNCGHPLSRAASGRTVTSAKLSKARCGRRDRSLPS